MTTFKTSVKLSTRYVYDFNVLGGILFDTALHRDADTGTSTSVQGVFKRGRTHIALRERSVNHKLYVYVGMCVGLLYVYGIMHHCVRRRSVKYMFVGNYVTFIVLV